MEVKTELGKTYTVVSASGGSVTTLDGTPVKTLIAGQDYFTAVSSVTVISDDEAIVQEVFKSAPIGLLGGGDSGGSGEPVGDYVTMDADGAVTGGRLDHVEDCSDLQRNRKTLTSWNIPLPALKNGTRMFNDAGIATWTIPLPSLTNGSFMFCGSKLATWTIPLPNLTNGNSMFRGVKLSYINARFDSLENGDWMFAYNSALTEAVIYAPKLTIASCMLMGCPIRKFTGDFTSVTNLAGCFQSNSYLSVFESDLPKLSNGENAFTPNVLNKESALRILTTIPAYTSGSHLLGIGIHIDHQNDAEILAAIDAATAKGWTLTIRWNGKATA